MNSIILATAIAAAEAFAPYFKLGAALNQSCITGSCNATERLIVAREFNSITAENLMKPQYLEPEEGCFDFALADRFVAFGEEHDMKIIGHCLVWHNQMPKWFFVDSAGEYIDRDTLISRMRTYIHTVVGRYKGRVAGWDVVNEAIMKDGTLRESPWLKIIGEDYIELAFQFAHEADSEAELYYNDFSMAAPGKRDRVVKLVKDLKAKGLRIDAVGMQTHAHLNYPDYANYEKAIEAYAAAGVMVAVTEMDVSVLPFNWDPSAEITESYPYDATIDPWRGNTLPPEIESKFNERYLNMFEIFLRHHKTIDRVTFWGISDKDSWLNNFPVQGRTDHPLLFDRELKPKIVYKKLIELAERNVQK